MLTRWRIDKDPTPQDPDRRVLLLKGGMEDVRRLIRAFGAMCGRPRKEKSRTFNLSVLLHAPPAGDLARLEAELSSACPQAPAPPVELRVHAAPAPPAPAYRPPPPPPEPPAPLPVPEPGSAAGGSSSSAGEFGPPPAGLKDWRPPDKKAAEEPKLAEQAKPIESSVMLSAPEPGASAPLRVEPPPASAPVPAPVKAAAEPTLLPIEPAAPEAPAPKPAEGPPKGGGNTGPLASPALRALRASPLCGAALAPDSSKTLESLAVGSFNRFVHAAAMSIASNPGGLYNPLFVFGGAGSGKSHLLQALAQKLQEGGEVLLTSGPRLALAVTLATESGKVKDFESVGGRAKALLVDDMHLMGLSEENRHILGGLFKAFLGEGRQLVVASAYPPRLMGAFEEALGVRLASGHSAEFKAPNEDERREIARGALLGAGFAKDDVDGSGVVGRLSESFPQLALGLRRLLRLRALKSSPGGFFPLAELVEELHSSAPAAPEGEEEASKSAPGSEEPAAGLPAAVFFPSGEESRADWVWLRLRRLAQEKGWPFPWRRVARLAYDAGEAFGAPFWIAEQCQRLGPRAALVLAPAAGELAEHGVEVRAALNSLIECMRVELGWIPHGAAGGRYLQALLDMDPGSA